MRLRDKLAIARRFKAGESVESLASTLWGRMARTLTDPSADCRFIVESAIRDVLKMQTAAPSYCAKED